MSRLKKLIKLQSHRQFALQQLSTDSRMSEEIKQFHTEQVEFAERDGVIKALNFLLSLVKSTAIPVSDQIRSQISKLVSLLRIRDELHLHEQIRKRELGIEIEVPLTLLPECQIEFPHWDDTFAMLKMKKISITLIEDHRARQELIASILRRDAEIERKKADDAELKVAIQAQKTAADQLLMQKSMDAAREKSQRALDAAKEKEKRALDTAKEKEQRALELARDKEQRTLEVAEKGRPKMDAANEQSEILSSAEQKDKDRMAQELAKEEKSKHVEKEEQKIPKKKQSGAHIVKNQPLKSSPVQSEHSHSKKTFEKVKVPSEGISNIYSPSQPKTIDDLEMKNCGEESLLVQPDITPELSSVLDATEIRTVSLDNLKLKLRESGVELEQQQFVDCDSEQRSSHVCLSRIEMISGHHDICLSESSTLSFSAPSMISSSAPCQSPKSVEGSPRQSGHFSRVQAATACSRFSLPIENETNDITSPQMHSDSDIPIFESHQSNPQFGPWRPFVSSSRHFPPVAPTEMKLSPYEMALNLSCMDALHSFPALHETPTMKNKRSELLSKDVFGETHVPNKSIASDALPLFHQLPTNSKLLEVMNFEEVQLDRALRALRRYTDTTNKLSICAYEEILKQQRKLLTLLLPFVQTGFKSGELRPNPPLFNSMSVTHENLNSFSDDSSKLCEHFCQKNRLPLKTNLAAQRRQVLLAKCSFPRFSSDETLSSNSADILHLASMAESITNHNRGDPALWKSSKQKIKLLTQKRSGGDPNCRDIIEEVKGSFGSANYATKSLLLGNFAQEISSSLNRSFHERYSAAGRSVKR
jgi:hypothetical protein